MMEQTIAYWQELVTQSMLIGEHTTVYLSQLILILGMHGIRMRWEQLLEHIGFLEQKFPILRTVIFFKHIVDGSEIINFLSNI